MPLSHDPRQKSSPVTPGLSGPEALGAYFAPRQVLRLKEAALCLNLSYSHFYRRIQAGTLNLKIRKNEVGERYVLLADLIDYLFPPNEGSQSSDFPMTIAKAKPGRPRKGTEEGGR